jgi:hypothetical protein
MNHSSIHLAQWRTASFGIAADTTSNDLETLQAHLSRCKAPQHAALVMRHAARDVRGFLGSRVITVLLVSTLLLLLLVRVW